MPHWLIICIADICAKCQCHLSQNILRMLLQRPSEKFGSQNGCPSDTVFLVNIHPKTKFLASLCLLQVVYVARNPKDVIVSYFHHHKLIKFHNFTGDMAAFAEYFMNDQGKNNDPH